MPKLQALTDKSKGKNRLIFIGDDPKTSELVSKFAKKNGMDFSVYNETEWATLEEIDQYIQDEEVSQQIISLPLGKNTNGTLNTMAGKNIKKISQIKKLNLKSAARKLKIGRATLYRKLEKNGLHQKKEREEFLKKKKAA